MTLVITTLNTSVTITLTWSYTSTAISIRSLHCVSGQHGVLFTRTNQYTRNKQQEISKGHERINQKDLK